MNEPSLLDLIVIPAALLVALAASTAGYTLAGRRPSAPEGSPLPYAIFTVLILGAVIASVAIAENCAGLATGHRVRGIGNLVAAAAALWIAYATASLGLHGLVFGDKGDGL